MEEAGPLIWVKRSLASKNSAGDYKLPLYGVILASQARNGGENLPCPPHWVIRVQ